MAVKYRKYILLASRKSGSMSIFTVIAVISWYIYEYLTINAVIALFYCYSSKFDKKK